jgi:hypothetical protein
MEHKEVLGFASTAIAIVSYLPYFIDILKNRTKPHTFTWIIWGVLTSIAFVEQIKANAGPGSWVTGSTALICLFIAVVGYTKKQVKISRSDWLSLSGAAIVLGFLFITKDAVLSIILLTAINGIGYIPTFRKSFNRPFEETLSTYFLGGLKFVFAVWALQSYSFVTIIFPLSIIILSWGFVLMIITRRIQHTPAVKNKRLKVYMKAALNVNEEQIYKAKKYLHLIPAE